MRAYRDLGCNNLIVSGVVHRFVGKKRNLSEEQNVGIAVGKSNPNAPIDTPNSRQCNFRHAPGKTAASDQRPGQTHGRLDGSEQRPAQQCRANKRPTTTKLPQQQQLPETRFW